MTATEIDEKGWLDLAYYLARKERLWLHQAMEEIEFLRRRDGDEQAAVTVTSWIQGEAA